MQKDFIAIESVIYQDKLIGLLTSSGQTLTDENGLDSDRCIEWLYNLVHLRKRAGGLVFVCYGFARSNEFIFSTLPVGIRDKLFQSHRVREQVDHLELERDDIDETYYYANQDSQEYEQADFERHVVNHSLNELREVKYNGYDIELINGKLLTIRKGGKAVSIYDIQDFFKGDSFGDVVNNWLGGGYLDLLGVHTFSRFPAWQSASVLVRKIGAQLFRCSIVAQIADRLNNDLTAYGFNLSRYHGAGALASNILSRSHAKKQFYNYRKRRQHAPELYKALHQAYYAGRAEQFKIGTVRDVKVYDINSAYANACTFLPTLLRRPRFARSWQDSPFSLWFCEYDFSSINPYFGLLPDRAVGNSTTYKLKGSGYFWQPEIVRILQRYPQCIDIKHGYVYDYEKAAFTDEIEDVYRLRTHLQSQGHPLQKVLGIGLSAIYGKFKQDKSHYYNLAYAGFITSYTRMQLLDATDGLEDSLTCFQTDAIHSTRYLEIPLSNEIGEYKLEEYSKITYLDQGIYQAYDLAGNIVKTKTRGFKTFDFIKALDDLRQRQSYAAIAEFFIGHNLYVQNMFQGVKYLSSCEIKKDSSPLDSDTHAMRKFDKRDVDLSVDFIDSRITDSYSGRESAVYTQAVFRSADINARERVTV